MKKIQSALISVYHKDGLENIIAAFKKNNVTIYSTGGTQEFIEQLGVKVERVEDLTSYPSILDGRVKTLHPKVFGGILARRAEDHLSQLEKFEIPEIDCVIVDLYPFEETVKNTNDEATIIEKIDIGGISLIRAAAKNFKDVVVVPSMDDYGYFEKIISENNGSTSEKQRRELARRAFRVSSNYDVAIFNYFDEDSDDITFKQSIHQSSILRYGENPHQQGIYFGDLDKMFDKRGSKELSYNNLVDVDAAMNLMAEFQNDAPTFAVLKHTNACGIATRSTVLEAWKAALAGDPVSAFGGILISNTAIDMETAKEIDKIFYEVLIAPEFSKEAIEFLTKKKNRILLTVKENYIHKKSFKSLLNGVIQQDTDLVKVEDIVFEPRTVKKPSLEQLEDLKFANKCVKHLKSNTIVFASNKQLLGMGCGQTSRVDACRQAIDKARNFGFELEGAVMASDAFFPFSDCVEIAGEAGIKAIVQPGGSIKDQDSINACNNLEIAMVFTGIRHFKH